MDYIKPKDPSNGRSYENTIFGALLSVSCIVKNENGPYEFFDKPSQKPKREHDVTESNIHQVSTIFTVRYRTGDVCTHVCVSSTL